MKAIKEKLHTIDDIFRYKISLMVQGFMKSIFDLRGPHKRLRTTGKDAQKLHPCESVMI
jgi:hypothetical protein